LAQPFHQGTAAHNLNSSHHSICAFALEPLGKRVIVSTEAEWGDLLPLAQHCEAGGETKRGFLAPGGVTLLAAATESTTESAIQA